MTDYYVSYAAVALLAVVILLFGVGTFAAWRSPSPAAPELEKLVDLRVRDRRRRRVLEATQRPLLHLRFPLRRVRRRGSLPLPVGRDLRALGLFAVVEMILFVVILFFGLAYAWGRKVLEWA